MRCLDSSCKRAGAQTRHRAAGLGVLLALFVSLLAEGRVAHAQTNHAQSSEDRVSQQLSTLLGSKKVYDLRLASKLVSKHPTVALPFLSTIARRATHPELTEAFRFLVRYATEEELEQLSASAAVRQKVVLLGELNSRRDGSRSRLTEAVKSQVVRGGPTNVPASPAPNSPVPRNPTPIPASVPPAVRPPTEPPGMVVGQGAMRDLVNQESAKGRLTRPEAEQRLFSMMTRPSLSDEDWEFLFALVDGDVLADANDFLRLKSRVEQLLFRHSLANWDRTYAKFLDLNTKHPERLIHVICRKSPRPDSIQHRIFELAQSEDPEVSKIALRSFPASRTRNKEYAEAVFQWAEKDPSRIIEYAGALAHCTIFGSAELNRKVLEWMLGAIEIEAAQRTEPLPDYRHIFACTARAAEVARRLDPNAQDAFVGPIAKSIERSKYPMQYLRILDAFKCNLGESGPAIRDLIRDRRDPQERLVLYRHLYRAERELSGALQVFEEAIQKPELDWPSIRIACAGIQEIGPDARLLVPRLAVLLDETDNDHNRRAIIQTFGAIGRDASSVVGSLVDLYPQLKSNSDRMELLKALQGIGSGASAAIPMLIEVAGDQNAVQYCRTKAVEAMLAIDSGEPRVREACASLLKDRSLLGYTHQMIRDQIE